MKKAFSILILFLLAVGVSACGRNTVAPNDAEPDDDISASVEALTQAVDESTQIVEASTQTEEPYINHILHEIIFHEEGGYVFGTQVTGETFASLNPITNLVRRNPDNGDVVTLFYGSGLPRLDDAYAMEYRNIVMEDQYVLFTVGIIETWYHAGVGYLSFDLFTAHYRVCGDSGNLTPLRTLIRYGDNFRLYSITERPCFIGFTVGYTYEFFDRYGNLFSTETLRRYPTIEYLDCGTIMSLRIGAGTGVWWHRFYDTNNGVVSEAFHQVKLAQHRRLVKTVWVDGRHIIVVRDIFDKSKFYREFEFDFYIYSASFVPITHLEFLDENTLKIVHMGVELEDKTAILNID